MFIDYVCLSPFLDIMILASLGRGLGILDPLQASRHFSCPAQADDNCS